MWETCLWCDFTRKRHPLLRVRSAKASRGNWWAPWNVKNLPKIGDRDPGPRYYWQSIGADGQVSRFLPAALAPLPFFIPRCRWRGRTLKKMKKKRWRKEQGRRRRGSREESLNHAPSEYGRNYCRRLMSRCSRDASSLYEESSSSSLSSPPSIFHRSHREKTTNSFRETSNSQVSILLFSCC